MNNRRKSKNNMSERNKYLALGAISLLVGILLAGITFAIKGNGSIDLNDVGIDRNQKTLLGETQDAGETYVDETLFIGDSNTVRLSNFDITKLDNTIGYVGIGISGFSTKECVYFEEFDDAYTMLDSIELMQPKRIALMLGTNDYSMKTDSFIAEYDKAISSIKTQYPYSDIIICSVLPVGDARSDAELLNGKFKEFNEGLYKLAEDKGCYFLNSTEIMTGDDGDIKREFIESDGLHLSRDGAEAYMQYFRTHSLITEDTRPAVTGVPTRKKAPYMPKEEETPIVTAPLGGETGSQSQVPEPTKAPPQVQDPVNPEPTKKPEPTEKPEKPLPTPPPVVEPDPLPTKPPVVEPDPPPTTPPVVEPSTPPPASEVLDNIETP